MRRLLFAIVCLSGCGKPATEPVAIATVSSAPRVSVDDLRFNDPQLQSVAASLVQHAHARGIATVAGRNKVEQLVALEGQLGDSQLALGRVGEIAKDMLMTDGTQWSKLRRRPQTSERASDLLQRWQRQRLDIVYDYMSSNYDRRWISSYEWEHRFHDFVKARPVDAGTWGWIVLQEQRAATRQQYGDATPELAYRYYLESTGLGDAREASLLFSVPGVTESLQHQ